MTASLRQTYARQAADCRKRADNARWYASQELPGYCRAEWLRHAGNPVKVAGRVYRARLKVFSCAWNFLGKHCAS